MTSQREIHTILKTEAEAILSLPADNPYDQVVQLLGKTVKARGHLVVSGVGKAGDVGRKIASTFNSTGVNSVFLSPLDAQHGDLGVIHDNSVLFVISNSGKTREILELITLAKRMHPRLRTIALTGDKKSPVAQASDLVLSTGCPKEVCPIGLTPTTSVIAMLALADVLTVLSMKARKFTARDYAKRHHGGYLGTKAKKLKR